MGIMGDIECDIEWDISWQTDGAWQTQRWEILPNPFESLNFPDPKNVER